MRETMQIQWSSESGNGWKQKCKSEGEGAVTIWGFPSGLFENASDRIIVERLEEKRYVGYDFFRDAERT